MTLNVIVCRSPYVRAVAYCVTCDRRRPMAGTFGMYYGSALICFGCGDSYDSETCGTAHSIRDPRPFRRNWKAERLAAARRMWKDSPTLKQEMARQREAHFGDES